MKALMIALSLCATSACAAPVYRDDLSQAIFRPNQEYAPVYFKSPTVDDWTPVYYRDENTEDWTMRYDITPPPPSVAPPEPLPASPARFYDPIAVHRPIALAPASVPLPGAVWLLGSGLLGLSPHSLAYSGPHLRVRLSTLCALCRNTC